MFNYTIDWNVDVNRERSPKVNKFKRDFNMISSYKVNKISVTESKSEPKRAFGISPSQIQSYRMHLVSIHTNISSINIICL